ncbi:MAG: NUDIX hydrolase [Thermodesulforhabdaceae bacterium]
MRENEAWSVDHGHEIYEVISELLLRDFPAETFREIAKSLTESCKDGCEITAVLFLICPEPLEKRKGKILTGKEEFGVALNKRSRYVLQPGDLCFPGGGIKEPLDSILSLIAMPFQTNFSLYPLKIRRVLSLLAVTALREAWEEVRLNPFKVRLCGVLTPYRLVMFRKAIVPVVGLVDTPVLMRKNSYEVEKIVWIPFSELLDPSRYARYRLYNYPAGSASLDQYQDFMCFIHQDGVGTEILWGATFRMVMDFLEKFFDFCPPPPETLPIVPGVLSDRYLVGRKKE